MSARPRSGRAWRPSVRRSPPMRSELPMRRHRGRVPRLDRLRARGLRLLQLALGGHGRQRHRDRGRPTARGNPRRRGGKARLRGRRHRDSMPARSRARKDARCRSPPSPGSRRRAAYASNKRTYSYGAHAAHVAVDPKTGHVELLDYVAVEDVGRIINPLTLHGQCVGAIVQGLGGAFLEHLIYDEDGQLLTGSFADYLLPTASDFPQHPRGRARGESLAHQSAGRQGRGRRRHHSGRRRHRQRGRRRARLARRAATRTAAVAAAGVGADPRDTRVDRSGDTDDSYPTRFSFLSCSAKDTPFMKLPAFDYACPTTLPEAVRCSPRVTARPRRSPAARAWCRCSPSAWHSRRCSSTCASSASSRHRISENGGLRSAPWCAGATSRTTAARRGASAAARPRSPTSRIIRSATAARSAAASPTPIRPPRCRAIAVTCDAEIAVVGPSGAHVIPAADFFHGRADHGARVRRDHRRGARLPSWPAGRRWGFRGIRPPPRRLRAGGGGRVLRSRTPSGRATNAHVGVIGVADRPRRLASGRSRRSTARSSTRRRSRSRQPRRPHAVDPQDDIHAQRRLSPRAGRHHGRARAQARAPM